MMRRCSRISFQHRFHGPTDGTTFTFDQLKRNVDMLALAWEGPRCVAMGALAPDSEGAFHLGVSCKTTGSDVGSARSWSEP
jgi:hypothetical protein